MSNLLKRAREFAKPYMITDGKRFRLSDTDPQDTGGLTSEAKPQAKEMLQNGVELLSKLQDMLYAQDNWALLIALQAMDAAGKDGAIRHVMSGVNPQGCEVTSFKAPSATELDHDYLWRAHVRVPERGRIGIFNRSYYEEVLVVRVHQEYLETQKLPPGAITKHIWDERYEDIRNFERYLSRNGIMIRKFFLHVSRDEQKRRFLERVSNPDKNWKFSDADATERTYWKSYMQAYEEAIRNTATKYAPWYVIPADNKWFTRLVVAAAIIEALDSMNLNYPKVSKAKLKELSEIREKLSAKD